MPASLPTAVGSRRLTINAQWFGRLRWVAAAGQLATIAFVSGPLGVPTPVGALLLLVGVTLISNAVFWWWSTTRTVDPPASVWHLVLGTLMLLDLVVLTAMLGLTGGQTNPFVVFYFVNLALSGVVLPAGWAWSLCGLAIGAVLLLSMNHVPVNVLRDPDRLERVVELSAAPLAVVGVWIAFAASATVIVNFTTRLTAELRDSERLRRQAVNDRVRSEKLEALGTLAAGAAHELATPLSTIAVAVTETQRELQRSGVAGPVVEDLELVRSELDRCRTILDRMGTKTGQPTASVPEELTAEELVGDVLDELPTSDRVEVVWRDAAENLDLLVPAIALAQAIRAVVQNAIDATDEIDHGERVTMVGDRLANTLRLTISDRGPGMRAEVLARASDPFFTTKPPGRGMGLGLFLARSVIEKLGGSLRLESPEDGGTVATIVLPCGGGPSEGREGR